VRVFYRGGTQGKGLPWATSQVLPDGCAPPLPCLLSTCTGPLRVPFPPSLQILSKRS
jgi:hypothetical protein